MSSTAKRKQKRSSKSEKGGKYAAPIIKAAIIGLLVTAVLLLLFSFVLSKEDIPFSLIHPISIAALILGSMVAGISVARQLKEKGLLLGSVAGAVIFAVLLFCSTFFPFSIGPKALLKFVICTISGAIGGVMGMNIRNRPKSSKRKQTA